MVVRMRHTRAHTGNRRSHHALGKPTISVEKESGLPHVRHRASPFTGRYRGKIAIDVAKKAEKKAEKNKKANQK